MFFDANDPRTRMFLASAGVYLVALIAIVAVGGVIFQELYSDAPTRPVGDEDTALGAYDLRYRDAYESYAGFLRPTGLALALYLGTWSAAFGVWRREYWQGGAALAVGGILTVIGLSILPWFYFPLDQYAVPALWIMGNALPLALCWLLVTFFGEALTLRAT